MRDGIEGQAAHEAGGLVALAGGHPAVGHFMHDDAEQGGDQVDSETLRVECKIEHLPQVPCNGSNVDMRGGAGCAEAPGKAVPALLPVPFMPAAGGHGPCGSRPRAAREGPFPSPDAPCRHARGAPRKTRGAGPAPPVRAAARPRRFGGLPCREDRPASAGAAYLPPVRAWLSSMSANSSRDVMPPSRRTETQFLLSIW